MIKAAIESQSLKPKDTIVEASSGNTGTGIAFLAQQMGFKCRIYVTKDCPREKLALLRELNATVVTCVNSNGMADDKSTQSCAAAYARDNPDCFFTDQYTNPQNTLAHFETTGPEIWKQTEGTITHFFAGIGTGGTICGVGKYLKQQNKNIKILGVEPKGSILSYYKTHKSLPNGEQAMEKIDGIGRKFVPKIFNPDFVDQILQVNRQTTIQHANEYHQQSGTLLGFSGAAVLAGLETFTKQHTIQRDDHMVLLFADYGDRYLNSLYPTLTRQQIEHYEKL